MSTKTPADFYSAPVPPIAFLMWKRLRQDYLGPDMARGYLAGPRLFQPDAIQRFGSFDYGVPQRAGS